MRTARKLATTSLAAGMAVTLGLGVPAAEASAPTAEATHAAKKRKRPTGGQCTVWASYKRPDLRIGANGGDWDDIAKKRGFPVDTTPRAGDIALWDGNTLGAAPGGHVAYVMKVRRNGNIDISEFNWGVVREQFGTRKNLSPAGLKFIHHKPGRPR